MGQTHNKYGAWPINPAKSEITWLPVAASQTMTRGDFVIYSSNQVAIALAASAELLGVIAQDVATPAAGTLVPVYADPDTVFEVIADADSSSLGSGDYQDIIGATGAMMMDADASSTDVLMLIRPNPEDSTSTANCRWRVKINKHALADTSS